MPNFGQIYIFHCSAHEKVLACWGAVWVSVEICKMQLLKYFWFWFDVYRHIHRYILQRRAGTSFHALQMIAQISSIFFNKVTYFPITLFLFCLIAKNNSPLVNLQHVFLWWFVSCLILCHLWSCSMCVSKWRWLSFTGISKAWSWGFVIFL